MKTRIKNLFLVLVTTVLVKDSCTAGTMGTQAILRKIDVSPLVVIMNIQISSEPGGTYATYTDLSGNAEALNPPAADGSFSFHIHLVPGLYSWEVIAGALANDGSLYAAPYNEPASDNAYTHYTFNFSANPSDGVTILSGLDRSANAGSQSGGCTYYPTWTFESISSSASPDGNVQFGSDSRSGNAMPDQDFYLYHEAASASSSAILSPSNNPSCLIDLICLAQSWTSIPEPDGSRVSFAQASAGASFNMQIIAPPGSNATPIDCIATFANKLTKVLGPTSNGQSLGILPTTRSLTDNPYFPSYLFTNVPSGSLIGIPASDGVDYEFSFLATSPTLFQSMILPNCTNSLTVTVSNVNLGSFSGGQTVYFTNFPSGGVSQFNVSANGQPLPAISGLELPLVLAFNSPTGAFSLKPTMLRIVAPVTDQALKPGQDLTIQPIVNSEQPIQYQWQFQDNDLLGQTNALLAIPAITSTNTGNYRLKMQTVENGQTQTLYSPEASVVAVTPPTVAYAGVVNGTNGLLQFTVSGTPSQAFFLQSSTDLQNWQTIATNSISTNGLVVVPVSNNVGSTGLFLRTVSSTAFQLGP
jgi:hypothetical protein